jgi:hypothetical protein
MWCHFVCQKPEITALAADTIERRDPGTLLRVVFLSQLFLAIEIVLRVSFAFWRLSVNTNCGMRYSVGRLFFHRSDYCEFP